MVSYDYTTTSLSICAACIAMKLYNIAETIRVCGTFSHNHATLNEMTCIMMMVLEHGGYSSNVINVTSS